MSLADALTLKRVRDLAGSKSFARGLAYFHDGAVGLLEIRDDQVKARVQGMHTYRVKLAALRGGELDYDCTCPVGADGEFCKHAVAVALSWLENSGEENFPPGEPAPSGKPRKKRKTQADTLAEFLATLPEAKLREWLMEAAARDRGLRDKLLMQARAASGGKPANRLASFRAAVLKAARQPYFLDWREAQDFADRLHDVAELIGARIKLAEPGLPAIIEETIRQAEASLENVDDSNGAVQEALHRLGETHLAACKASKPDATELAERLFRIETAAEWDFYPSTVPHYLGVLGADGLRHYRQRVLEAAGAAPVKTRTSINSTGYSRYTIEQLLDRLCRHDGNDTPMLRFLEKDLGSAFDYLKLAERHLNAGRAQQALEWAERGLAAYPDKQDGRLTDFCIALHRKHGQTARADELAWKQFAQRPYFESWQRLLKHTPQAKRKEAGLRGIAHLEQVMRQEESAPEKPSRNPVRASANARSSLVRIHLRMKNAEQVWQLANGHAINDDLWPQVAQMRGQTHPEQAIAVYKKLLPNAVRRGQSGARYDEAHELVSRIRDLRIRQGRREEFRQELAALRAEYKAKRNFIKRLDSLSL